VLAIGILSAIGEPSPPALSAPRVAARNLGLAYEDFHSDRRRHQSGNSGGALVDIRRAA